LSNRSSNFEKKDINKTPNSSQQHITDFVSKDPILSSEDIQTEAAQELPPHRIKGYQGSNPFELADFLRSKVCENDTRKYYSFRGGRFYGGIAAADCVGCVLDCVFCWSHKPRCNPETAGKFYSAKHVVEKLMSIAKKNNYNKIRISGNEPTLCKSHLIEVLEYVPDDILFILETNGILLDNDYIQALTPFKHHLHVRVSLKGVTEEQFTYITAMDGQFLDYQIKALGYLTKAGISCNAAIMKELLNSDNFKILMSKLTSIDHDLAQQLEVESLILYPFIEAELARRGLNKNFKPE
jgi:uncharacterized Fe-S cluster-containing radical SAM superfamily protein